MLGASIGRPLAENNVLDFSAQIMMMAGMGLMCWLLLRGKMRRKRQSAQLGVAASVLKHNANARTPPSAFSGTQSLGAPPDVLKWQVELHDLGRELKAELDSKLVAVRSMTQSYDRAARRLAELIRMAEEVSIPQNSVLAEARRLAALGWDHKRIAAVLGMPQDDISALLRN